MLAFTRYCYCEFGMVCGIHKEGRGGVVYIYIYIFFFLNLNLKAPKHSLPANTHTHRIFYSSRDGDRWVLQYCRMNIYRYMCIYTAGAKSCTKKSTPSWSGDGFRPRARAARCLQLAIEDRKRARESDPALRTRAATPSSSCPTPCRQQPAARQSSSGARRPARRQLSSRRPRRRPRTFATSPRCGPTHTAGSHCGAQHTLPARPSR